MISSGDSFTSSGGSKVRKAKPRIKAKRKPAQQKVTKGRKRSPARRPAPQPVEVSTPTLDEQVLAATNMAYGGAEQALQGERQVSGQMQANIPRWYQEYRTSLQHATNQTGGAYMGALQAQANTAASSSALDAQQLAQQQAAMQADAAMRGATVDPAVAAQAQQASASRRSMLDAYTAQTGQVGAAQVAFRANRQVVGAGQQLNAMVGEGNRRRGIESKATDLAKEKGQYAVTTKQKLLDQAHQRDLENKAFGLDVAKAEQDAATDAAKIAEARRARRTANRNADQSRSVAERRAAESERANRAREETARQRTAIAAQRAAGGGGKNGKDQYGNTPAQRRSAQDGLDRAKALVSGLKVKPTTSVDSLTSLLVGEGMSALNARAAAELKVKRQLSPATAAKLRRRGVNVGGRRKAKAKPRTLGDLVADPNRPRMSQRMPR